MRPPSAIVFDLDGTLVDSRRDLWRAVNEALGAVGAPTRNFEAVCARVGRGATHLVRQCLPADRRGEAEVEVALAAFSAAYTEGLAIETRPFPGVEQALAAAPAPLAVLTNKPGPMARALLEALGLSARFAQIVGAGELPALKPDPRGLAALLAALGAAPQDAWYVGDMPLDVEVARGAGCRAAAVTWGLGGRAALEAARPDRLLDTPGALSDLWKP